VEHQRVSYRQVWTTWWWLCYNLVGVFGHVLHHVKQVSPWVEECGEVHDVSCGVSFLQDLSYRGVVSFMSGWLMVCSLGWASHI